MRFLADENFPGEAVANLQEAGHDILWVRNIAPGMSDADIIAWAARENRVVLTFDKDFGELARGADLPPLSGVILFRIQMPSALTAGANLAGRIGERTDWAGHFSVVEPGRIRMRLLEKK